MHSPPKIETVFGDAASFKKVVDRFFEVYGRMQASRDRFARNAQAVLGSLAAHQAAEKQRTCPADAVALAYSRAFHEGQHYYEMGKELERAYTRIKELNDLGETKALTPDYRWKVSRALKIYKRVLTDFREMRASFSEQISGELTYMGCQSETLLSMGSELEKQGAPPTAKAAPLSPAPTPKIVRRRWHDDQVALERAQAGAATATFFVDNSTCKTPLRVYVDGGLLGDVGSGAKAAFQAVVGQHDLCLIPATSKQACGDPGTLRKAYVHDGWTITLRCD